MPLETYHRKRDFGRTPEPAGATPAPSGGPPRFVVQRHRATRLHYDFRLEVDGVLVSWAVPRGPSMRPLERRMAARTEDHPIEYLDFEGVIPKGEYGGGDVIVWDIGTWTPEAETADPAAAIAAGELKFVILGERLRGRYVIVRTSGRRGALDADDGQVKAGVPALWDSSKPAAEARIDLSGAVDAPLPGFIPPMLATPVDVPFSDPDWLFEMKLDGYRVEA